MCLYFWEKKFHLSNRKKLRLKGVTNVILLYDFDAIKDIKRYGLRLENYFVTSISYTMKKGY